MVAKTITLPNIRKAFIPDPGMVIGDFDLKGADAQVVAWEANAPALKEFFRRNEGSIHDLNAAMLNVPRQLAKAGCHLTNYGGSAKTLASTANISLRQAEAFQHKWFSLHPGIKDWHERVWQSLLTTRSVSNAFGYKITFYDELTPRLLPEALAWIPQSTVGLIISKALIRLHQNHPWIIPLLQVHDSLVVQFPADRQEEAIATMLECLAVPVPYDDPLCIPASYSISANHWG